jgi:hypothetical protein
MYAYLPLTTPGRVSAALRAALAMPKSTSLSMPSKVTTRFCGEMSRWTTLSGVPSEARRSCA